jgi:chromosome segregation ATPase
VRLHKSSEPAPKPDELTPIARSPAEISAVPLDPKAALHGRQLAQATELVRELKAAVADLKKREKERENEITGLKKRLVEREADITTLERTLAERDAEIAALKAEARPSAKRGRNGE